ncbi:MAG: ABC transporter permease [Candidatus Marsarchaeota archaeon]|nr:ABC transporter permease [Candidatus Marsarchaeota archaeon]
MNPKDVIKLSIQGMSQRKLRTGLTVLTVMIGVATIIALISLVAGVTASITQSLDTIGPTTIYMSASGPDGIFTNAQISEIESLPNVSSVIPMLRFSANITTSTGSSSATVLGIENSSLGSVLGKLDFASGSLYSDSGLSQADLGYSIVNPTSGTPPSIELDQPLYLSGIRTSTGVKTVPIVPTGVLGEYGTSFFVDPDTSIFMPLTQAEGIIDKYSYNVLVIKATSLNSTSALSTLLSDIFGNSAIILSVQSITSTVSSITGTLSLLLGSIGGISLIVAGIGILSIMMVSVSERTKEIGILKSIGFKQRDVMLLFLSEAMMIGVIGGMVGMAAGAAGSYVLPAVLSSHSSSFSGSSAPTAARSGFAAHRSFGSASGGFSAGGSGLSSSSSSVSFSPVITIQTLLLAFGIAILISVAAGLYPAWKASKVDPIIALRSE